MNIIDPKIVVITDPNMNIISPKAKENMTDRTGNTVDSKKDMTDSNGQKK